jgi:hypothetical protein
MAWSTRRSVSTASKGYQCRFCSKTAYRDDTIHAHVAFRHFKLGKCEKLHGADLALFIKAIEEADAAH